MSKELELIAEGLRAVATEGHKGAPGARDDGQLWGAFPNSMTVHDLAAHVVSVLAASGHTIVKVPKGTVREYGGLSWGADEDGEYPTVTATPGYDTVRLYVEDARHTREGAVEIAGFLLAAAAAAEEDKS